LITLVDVPIETRRLGRVLRADIGALSEEGRRRYTFRVAANLERISFVRSVRLQADLEKSG